MASYVLCESTFSHMFYIKLPGVVGIKVPRNISPPCVALCGEVHLYMDSSLHATLSITLTPCKSMEGGLIFQGVLYSSINRYSSQLTSLSYKHFTANRVLK